MKIEAVSAGYYESPGWHQKYQRIQLLTIAELLRGAKIAMPPQYGTFKRSSVVREVSEKQQELEMFS